MTKIRPSTQLLVPNDATKYLDGTGAWSTPASGAGEPLGLTGVTNPTRYVGGTTTGAPTTGTFAVGDFVVTADGHIWVCTTAGSPGTWHDTAGSGSGMTDPTTTLGDLIVHGPSGTTRLGAGTNGQVLTANSAATNGLDWETPSGGSGGGYLAVKRVTAGSAFVTTTSTTFKNVDATNLVITFTAPASGNVVVVLSTIAYGVSNTSGLLWNLRNASGDIANTSVGVSETGGASAWVNVTAHIYVTGLTAGNSYTWYWGMANDTGTGSTGTWSGNAAHPAFMAVLAA